jgi:hypothetical protein
VHARAASWQRRAAVAGLVTAVAVAVAAPVTASSDAPGVWRKLPRSPVAPREALVSVWTGKQMILAGRITRQTSAGVTRTTVAAAYDPASRRWRRLPSAGPTGSFLGYAAVWTGREMLVWGQGTRAALAPTTGRWRRLPGSKLLSIHDGFGLVAWTGKELLGWGGGCCGDAFDDGVAFDPAANRWRALPRSPLAGSQHPIGAWTGRELIVLVGDVDPDGKPWPARLARAAAYDPASNTWRRLPPIPQTRYGANAVWDGRELLVVAGAGPAPGGKPPPLARVGFAFDPATNRWRALPAMEAGRTDAAAVWTGSELLLWGGSSSRPGSSRITVPPHGLAFDPRTNTWSALPAAPLLGRTNPAAIWTGRQLLLWGGSIPKQPAGGGTRTFADGASFTPAP